MDQDRRRSISPHLITMRDSRVTVYDLVVWLPHLKPSENYTLGPWLRITSNDETGETMMAAGIKARKKGWNNDAEADGA